MVLLYIHIAVILSYIYIFRLLFWCYYVYWCYSILYLYIQIVIMLLLYIYWCYSILYLYIQIVIMLLLSTNYIPVVINHLLMAFYTAPSQHYCKVKKLFQPIEINQQKSTNRNQPIEINQQKSTNRNVISLFKTKFRAEVSI